MKFIILIISVFALSICSSCFVLIRRDFDTKEQTQLFTASYAPDINEKININGYYYSKSPQILFIFFKDGTYLEFSIKETENAKIGQSVPNLIDLIDFEENSDFSYGGGIYSIVGDTIIVDTYADFKDLWWDLYQYKFKILDKNTLEEISHIKFYRFGDNSYSTRNIVFHFAPASGLPSPFEAKVKKKKWMWSNKEDWKEYKKQLKEYLEQKKTKFKEQKKLE